MAAGFDSSISGKIHPGLCAISSLAGVTRVGACLVVRRSKKSLVAVCARNSRRLGQVGDKPKELLTTQVEAAVVNHIYGGMSVIAASAHGSL
jgi:hypothetical protein